MQHIVSLLSRLDAAIQRRFDSVCFFLMSRFGVRKSTLRYMFVALVVVGLAAVTVDLIRNDHVLLAFFFGIYLIFLLIAQHLLWLLDCKAESGDARAAALTNGGGGSDTRRNRRKLTTVILLVLAFIASSDAYTLTLMGARVFLIGRLLLLYISKTPMNPPAEKAEERITISQTAPVQT